MSKGGNLRDKEENKYHGESHKQNKTMETNKTILVNDIVLERNASEVEVSYSAFADRIVASEEEAKPILAQAIKAALELEPESVNKEYGLGVHLEDTYLGLCYYMVARVKTNDAEIEEFMSSEYPEVIETLDGGIEISYGHSHSALPGAVDFED